jgi:hypothetical protein
VEGRYEFDGKKPVAMAGGKNLQAIMISSLNSALGTRLRGSSCRALRPEAGLATIGNANVPWTAEALSVRVILKLPTAGIEVPVVELCEGLDFPDP